MKPYSQFIMFLLILLPLSVYADEKDKESLYVQLSRAVIRLEHDEVINQENADANIARTVPDGTAFFVHGGNERYIVTARHVVEKPHDLHARVQCRNKETGKEEVILLELPRKAWIYHNNNGDEDTRFVDVAVMKIPTMQGIKAFRYELKDSNEGDKNQLPFEDPEPPHPILVFGFPTNVGFQLFEQKPLGRLGIVSMKTEKEFLRLEDGKFAEERCCLIDARMFRSNSGSPVMNQIRLGDSKPQLLGLVIAINNSLDFGVIEPVSRIRETLDMAKSQPASGHWKHILKKESKQTSIPESRKYT